VCNDFLLYYRHAFANLTNLLDQVFTCRNAFFADNLRFIVAANAATRFLTAWL